MLRSVILFAALALVPCSIAGSASVKADVSAATYPDTCFCDYYSPVPLYRSYNSKAVDHFYTTSINEANNAVSIGWSREGTAGNVLSSNQTGAVPLFRLWNPSVSDHFYTVSASERASVLASGGWSDEGIAAYILAKPACGTIPLYRTFQAANFDHFYTTNTAEMVNAVTQLGYAFEATIGFIWPA